MTVTRHTRLHRLLAGHPRAEAVLSDCQIDVADADWTWPLSEVCAAFDVPVGTVVAALSASLEDERDSGVSRPGPRRPRRRLRDEDLEALGGDAEPDEEPPGEDPAGWEAAPDEDAGFTLGAVFADALRNRR